MAGQLGNRGQNGKSKVKRQNFHTFFGQDIDIVLLQLVTCSYAHLATLPANAALKALASLGFRASTP